MTGSLLQCARKQAADMGPGTMGRQSLEGSFLDKSHAMLSWRQDNIVSASYVRIKISRM